MIEVRDADRAQLARLVERANEVCERDRIGSARQRDHDASLAAGEIVPADELTDAAN